MSSIAVLCVLTICQHMLLAPCLGSKTTENSAFEQVYSTTVVVSGSSMFANSATRTTLRSSQAGNTRVSDKARDKKLKHKDTKSSILKNPRQKQLRMLDFQDDTCLRWSPNVNVTAYTKTRSIVVDYCMSEMLPIPNTYTCITKTNFTLCTILENPHCSHVFENLTAGNFTVLVKPLCKTCFDAIIYNRECLTAVFYVKSVILEDPRNKQELSSQMVKEQSALPTNDFNVVAVIASSCTIAFLVGVFFIVCAIKKCYPKSSSTSVTIRSSQNSTHSSSNQLSTSDDQTAVKTFKHSSTGSCQDQETSFNYVEEQAESEALLTMPHRLEQVTKEEEELLSNPEYQSCLYTCANTCPSVVTLNETCLSEDYSSDKLCDKDKHNTNHEKQTHLTIPVNCEETVKDYFNASTEAIHKPTGLRTQPEISYDIPYHLLQSSNDLRH